jgi:hypothetical protein
MQVAGCSGAQPLAYTKPTKHSPICGKAHLSRPLLGSWGVAYTWMKQHETFNNAADDIMKTRPTLTEFLVLIFTGSQPRTEVPLRSLYGVIMSKFYYLCNYSACSKARIEPGNLDIGVNINVWYSVMDEVIQNEVRAVIGMINGTQKAHNRYRHLSKSQENITGMPYIKHFYPINYAYSDLITFSFKAKTQYSPNNHPQKPNKGADQ